MPSAFSVPIPKTRDPFINTPLIRLSPDPKTGLERFWISTWNSHSGSTAALLDETGANRIYRFKPPNFGFYSAVQENDDTLWLCGDLSRVLRFTLSTGKVESYPTNAPPALNFQGMILDQASGKLFAAAFPPPKAHCFTFDFKKRKAGVVQPVPGEAHCARFSFPNGDGTWSLLMHLPAVHLVIWDPRTDKLEEITLDNKLETENFTATTYDLLGDSAFRRYVPFRGWYNPATRQIEDGPRPAREMTWKHMYGSEAIGCSGDSGGITVGAWDLGTGKVRTVCRIPDATSANFTTSKSGKVMAVNVFGEFFRFDITTGALEVTKHLASDAVGETDCLARVDKHRVLGTTFITQRFWEADVRTGKGEDVGRAAPGVGEIMKLLKVGKHIYMGAYAGGELTVYDTTRPPRYPENPRLIADPPIAMRPVAMCSDGKNVWYASSNEYGKLGCTIARYNIKTGVATSERNPLGDQMIVSMHYDKVTDSLIVGTSFLADCESCPPTTDKAVFARLHSETMLPMVQFDCKASVRSAIVRGPLGGGKWLISVRSDSYAVQDSEWEYPDESKRVAIPDKASDIIFAGKPGRFILPRESGLELWDLRKMKMLRTLYDKKPAARRIFVQENDVLLLLPDRALVLDGCLKV